MNSPKEIFQNVLGLKEDEAIYIPCRDYHETESTRVQLYQQRTLLSDVDPELASQIQISKRGTTVIITKLQASLSSFILKTDGLVEEVKNGD